MPTLTGFCARKGGEDDCCPCSELQRTFEGLNVLETILVWRDGFPQRPHAQSLWEPIGFRSV